MTDFQVGFFSFLAGVLLVLWLVWALGFTTGAWYGAHKAADACIESVRENLRGGLR